MPDNLSPVVAPDHHIEVARALYSVPGDLLGAYVYVRDKLQAKAAGHGEAVGRYAAALLDVPLPWAHMRTVYRLLGLAASGPGAGR